MRLSLLKINLAICKLPGSAPIPEPVLESELFSVSRTPDELSLVCPEDVAPGDALCSKGWRCLRVEGTLDFSLTGVIASLTAPLAKAKVPVFVFSTYDTDYILVKEADLEKAIGVLFREGHIIKRFG